MTHAVARQLLQDWLLDNSAAGLELSRVSWAAGELAENATPDYAGIVSELGNFMLDNTGDDELWEDAFPEVDEARSLIIDLMRH